MNDMSWNLIRLIYRAESPISIGYHKLGFIQRTRYYIPGRAMWGAMTAAFTRRIMSEYGGASEHDYLNIGQNAFNRYIIPGYFFPALDPARPFLPRFTTDGLRFGAGEAATAISEAEFENMLIGSMTQTAITPQSLGAEDESLHETEFILNHPRGSLENGFAPVYFVGHLWVHKDAHMDLPNNKSARIGWNSGELSLRPAVERLIIGGETKYGAGRLKLFCENDDSALDSEGFDLFGNQWDASHGKPVIRLHSNAFLAAHALAANFAKGLCGDIDPLVGREWESKTDGPGVPGGAGRKRSEANICWVPGSRIVSMEGDLKLELGDYGIWR
jgi:hypothetical protein